MLFYIFYAEMYIDIKHILLKIQPITSESKCQLVLMLQNSTNSHSKLGCLQDQAQNACQGWTLLLIMKIDKLRTKKFSVPFSLITLPTVKYITHAITLSQQHFVSLSLSLSLSLVVCSLPTFFCFIYKMYRSHNDQQLINIFQQTLFSFLRLLLY